MKTEYAPLCFISQWTELAFGESDAQKEEAKRGIARAAGIDLMRWLVESGEWPDEVLVWNRGMIEKIDPHTGKWSVRLVIEVTDPSSRAKAGVVPLHACTDTSDTP